MADEPKELVVREQSGLDPYEKRYMAQSTVLASSKVRAPAILQATFVGAIGSTLIPVFMGVPLGWLVTLIGAPIAFVLWMLFAVLRVTVTETHVNVQYGLFGPKIPIESIENAEATTYDWKSFGGWGIKMNRQGEWIYNMPGDKGRAIRITWVTAKGKRRVTWVGTRDHTDLAHAINIARESRPTRALPEDST